MMLSCLECRHSQKVYTFHFHQGVCSASEFVKLDSSELFYVDFNRIKIAYCLTHLEILISYIYNHSQARYTGEKLVAQIEEVLTISGVSALSLYDRELFLYDFLQTRITYERKDTDYYKAHSVEVALIYGRAVCEDYAGAFKLLCDKAEISALVVSGTAVQAGKTERHSWKIVKLHGQCHHVDVTWDSPMTFDGEISHMYFNLPDKEIWA